VKYILLAPALLFAIVFSAWPIVTLIQYSMLKTNFITTEFVGMGNYVQAFTDSTFMRSWLNSAFYMLIMVVGQTGTALMVALSVFNFRKCWHDAVRIIFYVPALAAGIIIAQSWRWIFHSQGPVNWMLGKHSIAWFAQAGTAIPAIALIVVTAGLGGTTIILLAGILGIDTSLYDAAKMDGATGARIKRSIIVPLLRPMLALVTLLAMIASLQIFETIYALAPYSYTATVTFHIYREAFQFGRFGLASAQAVVLLAVTAGLTIVKRRIEG